MATKPILARVLATLPGLGAQNGDLLLAPELTITNLADSGLIDPHPEAVAYAKSQGARIVPLEGVAAEAAAQLGAALTEDETPAT